MVLVNHWPADFPLVFSFLNIPWRVHADTLEWGVVTFCYFLLQSPFRSV